VLKRRLCSSCSEHNRRSGFSWTCACNIEQQSCATVTTAFGTIYGDAPQSATDNRQLAATESPQFVVPSPIDARVASSIRQRPVAKTQGIADRLAARATSALVMVAVGSDHHLGTPLRQVGVGDRNRAEARGGVAFVTARAPEHEFLALARGESFRIGGRTFTLVGGLAADDAFLARLARDRAIVVSLLYPGGALSTVRLEPDSTTVGRKPERTSDAVGELQIPLIRTGAGVPLEVVQARLQVTQSLTPLRTLLRSADSCFLLTAAGTGVTALLLAVWGR
jgi:hypothetical protein